MALLMDTSILVLRVELVGPWSSRHLYFFFQFPRKVGSNCNRSWLCHRICADYTWPDKSKKVNGQNSICVYLYLYFFGQVVLQPRACLMLGHATHTHDMLPNELPLPPAASLRRCRAAATTPRLPLQYTAHAASHPGALPKQLHPSLLLHPLLVPTLALLHFPKEKQQSWHNFVAIEILT